MIKELAESILEGLGLFLMNGVRREECMRKVEKNIQEYLQYEKTGEIEAVDSGSES